ncbi:hypothetical protein CVT25_014775 [Psilocybe cyanescens]|uniref:Dystroglycan-type cadherin-like domain-containing protein n=1 Tax=Psilocybe cyanescens TaxID=93625 RepID=A0A409XIA7_PSICY|nr:hypothetical protein CVT25_014775 [Psilocybe cyanescens]
MMQTRSTLPIQLFSIWCLVSLALPSLGQSNKQFQWQFANGALASSIPSCITLGIIVKPFDPTTNATLGVPPYYMISFAVGSTPQTAFIGTDANNLSWTVTHPAGSRLILSVVDSTGSAGGIAQQIFNVVAGQSPQCVIPPSTGPAFTVTANVTTDLTTCQPWGLTVKGGVPPYVVTLVEVNSPIVTNVTMPNGLDRFTYIDRADPNSSLIAGISDLTGRWASGTPLVSTKGSADVTCVGLSSSSGNATLIQQEQDAANASVQAAKRRHSTVIGAVVTLLLLLAIGVVAVVFFRVRKRKREDQAELAEAKPHQYVETQTEVRMLSITNCLDPPNQKRNQTQPASRKAAIMAEMQNIQTSGNGARQNRPSSLSRSSPASATALFSSAGEGLDRSGSATVAINDSRSPSRTSNPGFARFPATSIRQSGKLLESNVLMARSSESEYLGSGLPAAGEVVFQHQDAGVVRELPPPYADRLRRSQASSSS